MANVAYYVVAAAAEIAGTFAFWAWLRLDRSIFWVAPGTVALVIFAFALTRVDVEQAGRAFAAFGVVYIAGSLLWLLLGEGARPAAPTLRSTCMMLGGTARRAWTDTGLWDCRSMATLKRLLSCPNCTRRCSIWR